jgi:hypothetical protein
MQSVRCDYEARTMVGRDWMRLKDKNAMTDAKQFSSWDVEVSQLLAFDFLLLKESKSISAKLRQIKKSQQQVKSRA